MSKTIASHTIVKNGMPFIEPVLRNVMPVVDQIFVTVSKKSTDGTLELLESLAKEFPIVLDYEDVSSCAELTDVKNKQIDQTSTDWILALDDDDFWPTSVLAETKEFLDADVDGYAFNPVQIIDMDHFDRSWKHRYFTKLYKNQKGLRQEYPWPRDMPCLNGVPLNWKKNLRVKRLDMKFYHLSYIKGCSFRNDFHNESFKHKIGKALPMRPARVDDVKEIYSYVR